MDSYNNNHQSENLKCVKVISWFSLVFNLVIFILGLSLHVFVIYICPFFLHFSAEIFILIGIFNKNYCCYYTGIIICFLTNIFESILIFCLLLLASAFEIKNTEDIIFLIVIIGTGILIWLEFFVYTCYKEKVKTHCSFYIDGRVPPSVENLNVQPYAVPLQNIHVQNGDNQVQHNLDNHNMVYAFPPPGQNINNQDMIYTIPPPVKNKENQGID